MSLKVNLLVLVVMVLCVVGAASAVDRNWVGGNDGDNWCHEDNWNPTGAPGPNDNAETTGTPLQGPIIGPGCDANIAPNGSISYFPEGDQVIDITGGTLTCNGWRWSEDADSNGTINMSGGDVNVHGMFRWADKNDSFGTVNITGGTFTCHGKMLCGDDGGGELHVSGATTDLFLGELDLKARTAVSTILFNMSGRLIDIEGEWNMGDGDMSPGALEINFDSGYIVCGNFNVQDAEEEIGPGTMDFEEGAILEIRNDILQRMEDYIASGFFTGKDDTEDPTAALIGGHTFVGFDLSQLEASKPVPSNGTGGLCPAGGVTLSWNAGDEADQHKIFFGTSWDDVNEMTVPTETKSFGDETYDTGWLQYGQSYFWRVDEYRIADPCTWRGSVWSIGTASGQVSDPEPYSIARGMAAPDDISLSWTLPCYLAGQTLYYGTDVKSSVELFHDEFEAGIDPNWTSVGWVFVADSVNDANFGDRDSNIACVNDVGIKTLTSDDIDTSDYANKIHVSFYYISDSNVDTNDLRLKYYNGSTYVEPLHVSGEDIGKAVFDINDPDPCNTWRHFSHTITDSNFLIPNFRVQFEANVTTDANIYVDEVTVTNTWPVFPEWVEAEFGDDVNEYPETIGQFKNYGWRIDVNDGNNIIQGAYWRFTTGLGGLLMHYKFDGSGAFPNPITDDSGNNIEFTQYIDGGSLTYGESNPVINPSGASADFEPNAALFRLDPCGPSADTRDILRLDSDQYTVEMWVKPRSLPEEDNAAVWLIGKRDAWGMRIQGDNDGNFWYQWFPWGGSDEDSLEVGEWQHIAVVVTNDEAEEYSNFYFNGVDQGDAGGTPPEDNNNTIWIGVHQLADSNFTGHFDGLIDEIRIHDIAFGSCALQNVYRDPEYPICPYPEDGDPEVDPCGVILSWSPGESATSHYVYLSTDISKVEGFDVSVREIYSEANSVSLDLEYGSIYYWRVVEQSGGEEGEVWQFTTEYDIAEASLLLHYPLDETSGDTAYDASGHGFHGDVDDENWDPDGQFGGSLNFDNDNSIDVDGDVFENLSGGVSISLWLKDAYNSDGDNWVFDCGFFDNHIQAAVVEDSTQNVLWQAGTSADACDVLRWNLDSQNPATLEGWHHWVFIKNEVSGELKLYYDTELVKTKAGLPGTLAILATSELTIGTLSGGGDDLIANLDDFRIYDYVISEAKIEELFRGGDVTKAWAPKPQDGATDVALDISLIWKPGDYADTHDVYFGTSYDDVDDANTASPVGVVYRDNQGPNTYDVPTDLEFGKRYFWRIDEVNDACDPNGWRGNIWSFKAANFIVIDDFEPYNDTDNVLQDTWKDGIVTLNSSSVIYLGTEPNVHGGKQSMEFVYENSKDWWSSHYWSEVVREYSSAQDWDSPGTKMLTLYFSGLTDNAVGETENMWIALEDSSANIKDVDYDGDANDIAEDEWHEWNIALSEFTDVNTGAIKKIIIGFGDMVTQPVPGDDGVVWFDDIRIYPPKCIPEFGPPADLSGNCVVDYLDVRIMGEEWLKADKVFDTYTAPSPGPVGHWKLDEGNGSAAADDGSGNNDGVVEGSCDWVTGYDGVNSAIDFSGGRVLVPDATELRPNNTVSACAWINLADTQTNGRVVVKGADNRESYVLEANTQDNEEQLTFLIREGCSEGEDCNKYSVMNAGLSIDEWTHVAGTFDGTWIKLYINAELVAEGNDADGILLSQDTNDLAIGNRSDAMDRAFDGKIDDVQIYDYALSTAQVVYVATDGDGIIELDSEANLNTAANGYSEEASGSRSVNIRDFAVLGDAWLDEQLWPQ